MNKKIYSLLLGLLTLTGLLTGCKSNDDITFDHERQQFETRADRILLEFIAPFGTTANDTCRPHPVRIHCPLWNYRQ